MKGYGMAFGAPRMVTIWSRCRRGWWFTGGVLICGRGRHPPIGYGGGGQAVFRRSASAAVPGEEACPGESPPGGMRATAYTTEGGLMHGRIVDLWAVA